MSRTLRFVIVALAFCLSQASMAKVDRSNYAEKARQQNASKAACPEKVTKNFNRRPSQVTNTVIAKLMTGAGESAMELLTPRTQQTGVAQ